MKKLRKWIIRMLKAIPREDIPSVTDVEYALLFKKNIKMYHEKHILTYEEWKKALDQSNTQSLLEAQKMEEDIHKDMLTKIAKRIVEDAPGCFSAIDEVGKKTYELLLLVG